MTPVATRPGPAPSLVPPPGLRPRLPRPVGRQAQALVGRWCFDTRLPWAAQRRRLAGAARLTARRVPFVADVIGGVPAEWVLPGRGGRGDRVPRGTAGGVVVHVHGGGFCTGLPAMARAWAAAVARGSGVPVVLPDYRLAPEHPYPAAVDDVVAVVRDLSGHGPLVLSGDSAGANLVLAAAGRLGADGGGVHLVGMVLHCPWLDLARPLPPGRAADGVLNGAWLAACAGAYVAGRRALDDPGVSPLHAELRGMAPLVVQAAGEDLLQPDAEALVVRAREAGVPVRYTVGPGLWHDYGLQAGMATDADRAAEQAAAAAAAWTA